MTICYEDKAAKLACKVFCWEVDFASIPHYKSLK